jgi:hypothetical protein
VQSRGAYSVGGLLAFADDHRLAILEGAEVFYTVEWKVTRVHALPTTFYVLLWRPPYGLPFRPILPMMGDDFALDNDRVPVGVTDDPLAFGYGFGPWEQVALVNPECPDDRRDGASCEALEQHATV